MRENSRARAHERERSNAESRITSEQYDSTSDGKSSLRRGFFYLLQMVGRTFYVRVCIMRLGKYEEFERSSRNFLKLEKGNTYSFIYYYYYYYYFYAMI